MPVYSDLYIYMNIYFHFLWLSLCWMKFSDYLLISLIYHRSAGAVYEHRWISQDLTLYNWFLWPGLPHTRSYWQNRDSHRGASVSEEIYMLYYISEIYNFKFHLLYTAKSFAHICRHALRDIRGPWSSVHRNMVSHWTRCTAKWRDSRVPFWLS